MTRQVWAGNHLYVADLNNSTIRQISSSRFVKTLSGAPGVKGSTDGTVTNARFNRPAGIDVDACGNICIADTANHTLRRISHEGLVTTLAGVAGCPGWKDGERSEARFAYPTSVAFDSEGNVYVADQKNSTVRRVTAAGVVSTLAGAMGQPDCIDGVGSAARFSYPAGIAVDGRGIIYVADRNNSVIREVTREGLVRTLAGAPGNTGQTDGAERGACFTFPSGITADRYGNLFVADTHNHTIRLVRTASSSIPRLRIRRSGGQITLSWLDSGQSSVLEQRGALCTSEVWWPMISGVVSSGLFVSTVTPDQPGAFFRLRCP